MVESQAKVFCWDPAVTPSELHAMLRALGEHYPMIEGRASRATAIRFINGGEAGQVAVTPGRGLGRDSEPVVVRYDKPCHAARGLGTLLSGLARPGRATVERCAFKTFGIMLDGSRNAVMTVEHFKGWLRKLALLGFNMAMLYTEDTYALPGEEYFGYQRGRYTPDELRQIDDYAAGLGIEMIGCIQTLGHLGQPLRWQAYRGVRDTAGILLADEAKTDALIEKMIAHWGSVFRSRRIHIGQDEAYDLARGQHLDRFGWQNPIEVFLRHLGRTTECCRANGLSPMVWSDMFFKMAGASYREGKADMPPKLRRRLPRDLQLVLWDYYSDTVAAYAGQIDRHRELGFEPIMASGVWTWHLLWYDRHRTEANVPPCVKACRQKKVNEFFFTLWGDDGAYCEFDSALAGLTFGAEHAYVAGSIDEARVARRHDAICGGDYRAVRTASQLNIPHANVIWDDPLLGLMWKNLELTDSNVWPKAVRRYAAVARTLKRAAGRSGGADLDYAADLAEFLAAKTTLLLDLHRAYARRNRPALRAVKGRIGGVIRRLDAVADGFRRQWMRRNKPQGLEVIQLRMAAQRERLGELRVRIGELLAGRIQMIDELDERPRQPDERLWGFRNVASGSVIV